MKPKTKPITFRVPVDQYAQLTALAEEQDCSVGDLARKATLDAFSENQLLESNEEAMSRLREEILELRQDLAVSTRVLLVNAGRVPDADAQKWVQENLKK